VRSADRLLVRRLLAHPTIDPNAPDEDGATPLHVAAQTAAAAAQDPDHPAGRPRGPGSAVCGAVTIVWSDFIKRPFLGARPVMSWVRVVCLFFFSPNHSNEIRQLSGFHVWPNKPVCILVKLHIPLQNCHCNIKAAYGFLQILRNCCKVQCLFINF